MSSKHVNTVWFRMNKEASDGWKHVYLPITQSDAEVEVACAHNFFAHNEQQACLKTYQCWNTAAFGFVSSVGPSGLAGSDSDKFNFCIFFFF